MNDTIVDRSAAYEAVIERIAMQAKARTPLIVGLCGAQGSGKSTLVAQWQQTLATRGLNAATLSIDDFYLTRAEREDLGHRVHPLFVTRGVPGTHDIELTLRTLDELSRSGNVALPRFDKARDDRCPLEEWRQVSGKPDVILFEGWCVGARPQSDDALVTPINELECECDAQGVWRRTVNEALAGPYRALFAKVELLVLLRAPSFDIVHTWRRQQEAALRRTADPTSQVMNDSELTRFIQHYERLTRHILEEMPNRATVVVELDTQRNVTRLRWR